MNAIVFASFHPGGPGPASKRLRAALLDRECAMTLLWGDCTDQSLGGRSFNPATPNMHTAMHHTNALWDFGGPANVDNRRFETNVKGVRHIARSHSNNHHVEVDMAKRCEITAALRCVRMRGGAKEGDGRGNREGGKERRE